jgi:hypothetical protein
MVCPVVEYCDFF